MISKILLTLFALCLLYRSVLLAIVKRSTVCYHPLGCFSSDAPFYSPSRLVSITPQSPDKIKTSFNLYTKDNTANGQTLDARLPVEAKMKWTHFKQRKTQIIVHGFLDNPLTAHWIGTMKDELLQHGDYNTITVDWHHGNVPPYTQATANTRVVGAQIALLIKQLQTDFGVSPSQVHIIGHSLGAHIAGYAGERTPGLSRISGLDPAGPYFEGTDKVVRLDPTDADFVDAIHTDAKNILLFGFGINDQVGHLDFFPNLGHDQPGCNADPISTIQDGGLIEGSSEVVACNHLRSIKFFSESINSECPFMSFPCSSEQDFKNGKCHSCPSGGCVSMGFNADQHKAAATGSNLRFYTSTSTSSPFCQYHLNVKIKFGTNSLASEELGNVKITIHGEKGMSGWITLNKSPMTFAPGHSYEFEAAIPVDFGSISSVDFQWHHVSSMSNPLKWNILNIRHPKLFLEEVDVTREEQGIETHFCITTTGVETDQSTHLVNSC